MITIRLKAETAEHHKATEAVSFGDKIMGGTLTQEEYRVLIEKNYILHALIEKALETSGLVPAEFELTKRLKTQSLIDDLILLNRPVPALPSISVSYASTAEALGAL